MSITEALLVFDQDPRYPNGPANLENSYGEKDFKRHAGLINKINTIIDNRGHYEEGLERSINVFWYSLEEKEHVCLRFPYSYQDEEKSAIVALRTDSATRSEIMSAFENATTEKEAQKAVTFALENTIHFQQDLRNIQISADGINVVSDDVGKRYQAKDKDESIRGVKEGVRTTRFDEAEDVKNYPLPTIATREESALSQETIIPEPVSSRNSKTEPEIIPQPEKGNWDFYPGEGKPRVERVETENEEELVAIDSRVKRRQVYGKVYPGLHIHGERYTDDNYNKAADYRTHPFNVLDGQERGTSKLSDSARSEFYEPGVVLVRNSTQNFYTKNPQGLLKSMAIRAIAREKMHYTGKTFDQLKQAMGTQLIYTAKDGMAQITVGIEDLRMPAKNQSLTLNMFCEVTESDLNRLLELIRQDPRNFERFIQITFEGIDDEIRRRPVRNLRIMDADRVVKGELNKFSKLYELESRGLIDVGAVDDISLSQELPEYI